MLMKMILLIYLHFFNVGYIYIYIYIYVCVCVCVAHIHSSLNALKVTIYQIICSSALWLGKNVSQSCTKYKFRFSYNLIRMQGSVLGYEIKFYLNKSKFECVLQCVLWDFGINNIENKSTKT
jgi:hypothetical protein